MYSIYVKLENYFSTVLLCLQWQLLLSCFFLFVFYNGCSYHVDKDNLYPVNFLVIKSSSLSHATSLTAMALWRKNTEWKKYSREKFRIYPLVSLKV